MRHRLVVATFGLLFLSAAGRGQNDHKPSPTTGKSVADLIRALQDNDPDTSVRAAEALAALGPKAKEAGLALVDVMRGRLWRREREPKFEAAKALWQVDRSLYLNELRDNHPQGQWTAVLALTMMGPSAKEAIPILVDIIHSKNDNRPHALLALAYLDPNPKIALPLLTDALHDRLGQYARQMAAAGLEHLGPKAQPALQDLRDALDDDDVLVRIHAARAIYVVGRQTASALSVLRAALKDDSDRGGDYYAVEALALLGADAKPAVPDLLAAYQVKGKNVRERIVAALNKIDPEAAAKARLK